MLSMGKLGLGKLRFDVILTDMRMPDLDGISFYHAIQAQDPRAAARVLFVTGDTMTSNLTEFASKSGRPILEKPFMPKELRRIVSAVAHDKEMQAPHH